MTVRVRMLSGQPGYPCTHVCDVPQDLAAAWLAQGLAERVEQPPAPVIEAAPVAEPIAEPDPVLPKAKRAESAMKKPARKR